MSELKVTVVGNGPITRGAARAIARAGHRVAVIAEGGRDIASEIHWSLVMTEKSPRIVGGAHWSLASKSDVVVIATEVDGWPPDTVDEAFNATSTLTRSVAAELQSSPGAIVIVATSPVELHCHLALRVSGVPARQIVGINGLIASSRLRAALADVGGVDRRTIDVTVLGSEADPVPLLSLARVGGEPLADAFSERDVEDAIVWASVADPSPLAVTLSPAEAIAAIIEEIAKPTGRVMPLTVLSPPSDGRPDTFAVLPATIDRQGVTPVPDELDVTDDERAGLRTASTNVAEAVERLIAVR
jgi:malate/lactate dehydrogenase